jgi:hypothetical protein
VSSFRLIYIAAFTAATSFAAANAAAQTTAAADQSGKPYLAGLRPPHEHHKPAHLRMSELGAQRKSATKSMQPASKEKPAVLAKSKPHRPVRLADKINSRVAWPSLEPATAAEPTTSRTVLEFAPENTGSNPAPPPRQTTAASPAPTAKRVPPQTIAATDEPTAAPTASETAPTASTPIMTERFEASPASPMRVIMPAPNTDLVAGPASKDEPTRSNSSVAQLLATLAGAITAGIVGWLMIGFGPVRTIRSRQI